MDPERADAIHAFYSAGPKDFLLPRTPDALRTMATQGSLFELVNSDEEVLGACYVSVNRDEGTESPAEFGGILLADAVKGQGLAGVLARAALAVFFGAEQHVFMIAHVHVENQDPRLLLKNLGFGVTNIQESPPPGYDTGAMKTNDEGKVVGDVLLMHVPSLANLAAWLADYVGPVTLQHDSLSDDKMTTVRILQDLATLPQPSLTR